jgi:hypothetical protein
MADNILAFDKLPADAQAKLIELQTPGEDRFVFIPSLSKFYWLAIAAGIGWCVYLFASTENYLWESWMFGLFAAGSLILVSLALYAIFKIVSARFARLKDGYVFTKDECIKTKGNRVEFWSLKQLEGFQFREDIKTIEVWIGERVEKIKAENTDDAEKLERIFVEWHNRAGESFLSQYAKPETAYNGSMKYAAMAGGLIVLMAVSFGVSYTAKIMNRNYDDERTWQRLANGTTIADFEEYKQRHPNGIHKADADAKMAEIYGKLKDDYAKKVKRSADEIAVQALSEVLESAGKLSNRTIYVRINETRELDDSTVKKLKETTGYSINSYDYSIPPSEEANRKKKLLDDLSLVFISATRPASINFEMSDNPPEGCTTIDLNYAARSQENFYRFNWYSNGSITTFYNPAAKWEFDMTLKSADARELYKTNYISLFSNLGGGQFFDQRDAANYSFDKVYFAAVSQDFNTYLSRQFGFIE